MRKKFKKTLGFLSFLIFIVLGIGISYLYFNDYLKTDSEIVMSGPLSINYKDGRKLIIKNNKNTKITIINDSDEDAYYYIEFKNLFNIDDITYKLTNNKDVTINQDLNPYNTIISSYVIIKAGETENYDLTFTSKENRIYSLELNISVENLETDSFAESIIKNNEIKESPVTAVGVEAATTDEGLIKTTDDNGTAYYFRGAVTNNNVLINNIAFKIVKINGDGSVKLILNDDLSSLKSYYTEDNYEFKKTNIYNSLNSWLSEELYKYSSYIANQKYCNDLSTNQDKYSAYTRIVENNIPTFLCLGTKVSNKVGLLTADEVLFAGATLNSENKSFYLYTDNVTSDSFLMTSAKMDSGMYYPFTLTSSGKLSYETSGSSLRSVRPVITIIKTISSTGDGTVDNPYILTDTK